MSRRGVLLLVGLVSACVRHPLPPELLLDSATDATAAGTGIGETITLAPRAEDPLSWLCAAEGPARQCVLVDEVRCRAVAEPAWARCRERALGVGPEPTGDPDRALWLRSLEGCTLRRYRDALELAGEDGRRSVTARSDRYR